MAFPIFAFGIAQGCRVTRSPKRYLLRLALFAVISEVPYNLTLNDMTFNFPVFAFHNVFFTLLIVRSAAGSMRFSVASGWRGSLLYSSSVWL
ncbi:MAG: TraX family protein [Acutalibacteraceae bacterium]